MEEDELVFLIPNPESIPCLTCKHGVINFLATYCAKYKLKPNEVYYESKECPRYEAIK